MRPAQSNNSLCPKPQFLGEAAIIAEQLKDLQPKQIARLMAVSDKLAEKTYTMIIDWIDDPNWQRPAIDSFLGDIYSGLQVQSWSDSDREYANQNLQILSGLYGVLRPLDGIYPYRLEMGYKFPIDGHKNLYQFWSDKIAKTLPKSDPIINLSAVEYSKTVTPFIDNSRFITPKFLTISPKTGQPTFVTVHTKIARGAFAAWMIKNRIESINDLNKFADIGYKYDPALSNPQIPVYVCEEFDGIGLSVRLT